MRKNLISAIVFLIAALLAFSGLAAAETKPMKIKLSHTTPPDPTKNAVQAAAEAFKYLLEKRSGGRFEVDIYPIGTLGTEVDQMEAVTSGVTQMFFASMPAVARVHLPSLIGFSPYLFKNEEIALAVFEGPFGQKLLDDVSQKTGTKALDYIMGFNYFVITNNKRPLTGPKDLKGLKFRVMDPMGTAMFNAFGASAVPIAFAEVFTSLQTGVVDGQTNPPFIVESMKFNEVQKYLTLAGSQWGYQYVLANAKWFEDLSDEDEKLIRSCWAAARQAFVGLSLVHEQRSITALKKSGMKINVITPEKLEEFIKIGRPAGLAFIREKAGDALVDELLKTIAEVEKKLGY